MAFLKRQPSETEAVPKCYFQRPQLVNCNSSTHPRLFSGILKGLEFLTPNSRIFKDFSSTLWDLPSTTQ